MEKRVILLANSDKQFSQKIRDLLSLRLDCHIIEAADGLVALKIIKYSLPDLVLMDLYLPEMDGDECTIFAKEDEATQNIPIILVCANDGVEDEKRCLASGCDESVARPIHIMELLHKINILSGIPFRSNSRVALHSSIYFNYLNKGHSGFMENICENGMFIVSKDAVPVGDVIHIRFNLPGVDEMVAAKGEVVRCLDYSGNSNGSHIEKEKCQVIGEYGLAVSFQKISSETTQAITDLENHYIL